MTVTAEQQTAFEQSRATALDSAACLIAAFRLLGVPDSLLDIGCGCGHLVRMSAALGVRLSSGYDLMVEPDSGDDWGVAAADLAEPLILDPFSLVLCLEVAEHLPPESADTLCGTLAKVTSGTLLFSAATPGQGGSGHLNERPHEYWREKLEARGLRFDSETTDRLRRTWSEVAPGAWWYGQNCQVFHRGAP